MSLIQDASCYQGDHVILTDTVYTTPAKTARKTLAGSTVEYRLGRKDNDSLVLRITQTPNAAGSVVAITDPTNGIVQVHIRQADTLALPARRYTHQLIVIDGSGKPKVCTDGYLTVGETLPSA